MWGGTALRTRQKGDPLSAIQSPVVRDDVEPVNHETRDRTITGFVTGIPVLALGLVAWQLWDKALHWTDVLIFVIIYMLCGLGVTVGFHRLFTHRSFATSHAAARDLRRARLGRDRGPGDLLGRRPSQAPRLLRQGGRPAQPARGPWRRPGAARCAGLVHAHVGWLFIHTAARRQAALRSRPAEGSRWSSFVDRTFVLWVVVGLAAAFVLGVAIGGTADGRPHRAAVGRRRAHAGACTTSRTASTRCATSSAASASRHRRRVAQPALARAAHARRGVAQQPPRLPHLCRPRAATLASSTPRRS